MRSVYQTITKFLPSALLGVVIGVTFTTILTYDECLLEKLHHHFSPRFFESPIDLTIDKEIIEKLDETDGELNSIKHIVEESENDQDENNIDTQEQHQQHQYTNSTIAKQLKRNVRIICFILTQPENHLKKAMHVMNTWGRRCNKFLMVSTKKQRGLPILQINVTEDRDHLWFKTKEAFKYIYKHHFYEGDWFYKADDDTYANIENMRYFLNAYSPQDPIFFGLKFRPFAKQGYFAGGPGYVLSKRALHKFIHEGLPDPHKCDEGETGVEDAAMGACLERTHVYAGDTRDKLGRGRFFFNNPVDHLRYGVVDETYWYWQYLYYPNDEGLDCCSNRAISWHYIQPKEMLNLEFFTYKFRVYGRVDYPEALEAKRNFTEVTLRLNQSLPTN